MNKYFAMVEENVDVADTMNTSAEIKDKRSFDPTPEVFNAILATLPISLYTGRMIDVELSLSSPASYYDPLEDNIQISYPSMLGMLKKMQMVEDAEATLRALVYHELSHAILTPDHFMMGYNRLDADALNVFEDERIETVLDDYYYGVDFKRNIIQLNDWTGEPPQDAFSAFYHTVRFRDGKPEHLARVNSMIKRYGDIDKSSKMYTYTNYQTEIIDLMLDIAKDWLEENSKETLTEKNPNYDQLNEGQKKQIVNEILREQRPENGQNIGAGDIIMTAEELKDALKKALAGQGQEGAGEGSGQGGRIIIEGELDQETKDLLDQLIEKAKEQQEAGIEEGNEEGNEEDSGNGKGNGGGGTQKGGRGCGTTSGGIREKINLMVNKYIDNNLTEEIALIFESFLSRSKRNSAALPRYSGILNPRAVGTRDDWRIFEYKSNVGPIKGYDTLHLNLFIDNSCSYSNNVDRTNTLIKSLIALEQRYPFFTFDLVNCEVGEELCPRNKRYVQARGGTQMDKEVWTIFKQLQYPTSFNYNIVLFDGRESSRVNFGAFNSVKCAIISDDENEAAIKKYAPLAHRIIVGCNRGKGKSYAELLTDNVIIALTRALV